MSAVESSMTTEDSEKWTRLPDDKSIVRTVNALQSRGITAESVSTREDALKLLAKRIPPGAEVMTGASATLDEIGFLQLLKLGTHQWKNLKSEITGEKDPVRQRELRVRAAAANTSLEVRMRSQRQGRSSLLALQAVKFPHMRTAQTMSSGWWEPRRLLQVSTRV